GSSSGRTCWNLCRRERGYFSRRRSGRKRDVRRLKQIRGLAANFRRGTSRRQPGARHCQSSAAAHFINMSLAPEVCFPDGSTAISANPTQIFLRLKEPAIPCQDKDDDNYPDCD